MTQTDLLQAIIAQPDDDFPRLAYADWLEERGDPLGEFLRNQCRLLKLPPHDENVWELEGRQRALWAEHGAAWKATLPLALQGLRDHEQVCRPAPLVLIVLAERLAWFGR